MKKLANNRIGNCDGCGKDLQSVKWQDGEITACSVRCLRDEQERERLESRDELDFDPFNWEGGIPDQGAS